MSKRAEKKGACRVRYVIVDRGGKPISNDLYLSRAAARDNARFFRDTWRGLRTKKVRICGKPPKRVSSIYDLLK